MTDKIKRPVGRPTKEIKADCMVTLRAHAEDKEAWIKQAQSEGIKLSVWMTKTLNSASKNKKKKR